MPFRNFPLSHDEELEYRRQEHEELMTQNARLKAKERIEERKLALHTGKLVGHVKHGLVSTYNHYGCRCPLCREAEAAYHREMYRRKHPPKERKIEPEPDYDVEGHFPWMKSKLLK